MNKKFSSCLNDILIFIYREVQDNKKFKPCQFCHQLKEDKSLAKHQKICLNNPDRISTPRKNNDVKSSSGELAFENKEQSGMFDNNSRNDFGL